jgi:hypothetical protein
MARIRTIKPEFFTSEDIVSLSPLARLLYIALWCEADREGRLQWKPRTFKLRYLPADETPIDGLCAELLAAGLVVLYGDGLAYIPAFGKHQHINPRESLSTLPVPVDKSRDIDASARVSDAQGGREGEGREGDTHIPLARDWVLPKPWGEWAIEQFPHWTAETVRLIAGQFATHHRAVNSISDNWRAAWEKWCFDPLTQRSHPVESPPRTERAPPKSATTVPSDAAERTAEALAAQAAHTPEPPPENIRERLQNAKAAAALAGIAIRVAAA